MKTFIQYLKDVRGEMAHISWPTRTTAIAYTLLVIGISLFVAFYIGFFDTLFEKIITTFIIK